MKTKVITLVTRVKRLVGKNEAGIGKEKAELIVFTQKTKDGYSKIWVWVQRTITKIIVTIIFVVFIFFRSPAGVCKFNYFIS